MVKSINSILFSALTWQDIKFFYQYCNAEMQLNKQKIFF